jgi:uridine kinase
MASQPANAKDQKEEDQSPRGASSLDATRFGGALGISAGLAHAEDTLPQTASKGSKDKKHKGGPYVIGVTGGTASGKTSVCTEIKRRLGVKSSVAIVSQDSFYKSVEAGVNMPAGGVGEYNFDHPNAFDFVEMLRCLESLERGEGCDVPQYDFVTHRRLEEREHVEAVDVVVLEGILAFYDQSVRDRMHMKLFVDTDADVRLARRVLRDIEERGRDVEGVLTQYEKFVKPAFDEFILPTKKYADVIIPRGAENDIAIEVITQHIQATLDTRQTRREADNTQFVFEE